MEFKKERCFTALNADELKVGSRVFAADTLHSLLSAGPTTKVIEKIEPDYWAHRFSCDDGYSYALAYLIDDPNENKLKWTDLKIGDVITNGYFIAMVTEIDKGSLKHLHIYAGHTWINDNELAKWEVVE